MKKVTSFNAYSVCIIGMATVERAEVRRAGGWFARRGVPWNGRYEVHPDRALVRPRCRGGQAYHARRHDDAGQRKQEAAPACAARFLQYTHLHRCWNRAVSLEQSKACWVDIGDVCCLLERSNVQMVKELLVCIFVVYKWLFLTSPCLFYYPVDTSAFSLCRKGLFSPLSIFSLAFLAQVPFCLPCWFKVTIFSLQSYSHGPK